jgi:zinc finger SWIM domain-containing protein 3
MTSLNVDLKPKVGMSFENINGAYQFWLAYSARVGFGVRKRYTNKKKNDGTVSSCRFVCSKEGLRRSDQRDPLVRRHRAATRTDCKARISLTYNNGKFVIHEFVEDHNHSLQCPETTHMLASHRKITEVQAYEIDLAEDSGLRQKSTFQLLSTHAGHIANLGFTELDVNNYINAKRKKSMVRGEAVCLLQYFQRQLLENPSFFHAYQVDTEEKITNVFWCDANMVLDYGYFGDVLSLDTTYCTNEYNRPLALFSGFNHYRGSVVFGAALMYDETIESFKWLFDTFLQAHNNKKPRTVFTDQDPAMARALAEVMPETHHGLCTWHLMQNGIKHLGNLMKGGSYFLRDFKKCMYEFDDEAIFEKAWTDLINEYKVHDRNWIKSVYAINKKWASCYMKEAFTLGMRSTQVSESLNAHFKSCMKPNLDITQFFKHFERVVEEKRAKELSCEYDSSYKLARLIYESSPILIQMGKIYTHAVFELFQNEFKLFLALSISERNESHSLCEYVITMVNHEGSWRVSFDRASTSISCSCKKFDTFGILCSHALKVFEANDVKVVPEKYILRRWTREARCGLVKDFRGNEVEGDPKLSRTRMFKQVVSKFIRAAADASSSEECLEIVDNSVDDMCAKIIEFRLQDRDNDCHINDNPTLDSSDVMQPNGFKVRRCRKGPQRRPKSWVECQSKRGKRVQTQRAPYKGPHNQVSEVFKLKDLVDHMF